MKLLNSSGNVRVRIILEHNIKGEAASSAKLILKRAKYAKEKEEPDIKAKDPPFCPSVLQLVKSFLMFSYLPTRKE